MSRLNNKGQVLVLFILLLPLLLLVMVLVIDIGNIITAKQELNDINYLVIDSKLENTNMTDQEMIKLIGLNAKDLKNIDIQTKDNKIIITLEKEVKGLISHIVKIEVFQVKSSYDGTMINGKKKIERVK